MCAPGPAGVLALGAGLLLVVERVPVVGIVLGIRVVLGIAAALEFWAVAGAA